MDQTPKSFVPESSSGSGVNTAVATPKTTTSVPSSFVPEGNQATPSQNTSPSGFLDKASIGMSNIFRDIVGMPQVEAAPGGGIQDTGQTQNQSPSFIPQLVESTLGSKGLGGIAQMPGRVAYQAMHPDENVITPAQALGTTLNAASTVIPAGKAEEAAGNLFKGAIGKAAAGGATAGAIAGGMQGAGNTLESNNTNPTDIGVGAIGGATAGALGGAALGATGAIGANVLDKVMSVIKPDEAVINSYTKAVKPTIAGRTNFADTDIYNKKVTNGINAIIANKDNLSFNVGGVNETGRLPQSLMEFSDAINQTKQGVYSEYNALSKRAGQEGATIDLGSIGKQLDSVIGNKALQVSNPDAINYAKGIQERLNSAGQITPETAEQIVANYNASLKAFYRNPSYDAASRAAIDAGIANNLRSSLDSAIEDATGKEYQPLKNKYGALKAIEQDVTKRANVFGRRNEAGLLEYTNIFSGGDIANGLLTLNPAQFTKGVAEYAIKNHISRLNDPDRIISKMFEKAEKNFVPAVAATTRNLPIKTNGKENKIPITLNRLQLPAPSSKNMIGLNQGRALPVFPKGMIGDYIGPETTAGSMGHSKAPASTNPSMPILPQEPYIPPSLLPQIQMGPKAKVPPSKLPIIKY